jgi:hypothetical protein
MCALWQGLRHVALATYRLLAGARLQRAYDRNQQAAHALDEAVREVLQK